MSKRTRNVEFQLRELGFDRFASAVGSVLSIERPPPPATPAVYVATLGGEVFWVGQTIDVRRRFGDYRRWFSLADDSDRKDRRTRDRLLEITGGRELVFYWKAPISIYSEINGESYSAQQVEEVMLIDYFTPKWNFRKGGRKRG